ncbi:MAG TPA: peptide-binding protein [Thermodesulfobacteriota bacterium]
MLTRRDMLRLLGASGLALGGAGCSNAGAGGRESTPVADLYPIDGPRAIGDAMVSGSIGEASTFIWFLGGESASSAASAAISNSLLRYNDRIELEREVAESVEVTPDGETITFRMRRDVRWTDGHPCTADDVLFTYEALVDPATPTPYSGDYLLVRKAEVLDPYTFRVHYDKPFAPALESWAFCRFIPAHLLRGKDLPRDPYNRNPVGTGPYMLRRPEDWVPGQQMTLWRNPDYWEGTVWIERQVTRIIPDLNTQFLELKTGGIDAMGLTPPQFRFQTGTREFVSHFEKYRYLSSGYTFLGFNLRDPRFQDRRVRQAFAYAIDKDEIIRGVYLGYGKPLSAPTRPDHWTYNPNVRTYPYDPARALELFAEVGWKRDANGRLVKDGKPFRFEIITNQGNQQRIRTAEIIQRRLAEIGIEVSVRPIEWAAFINEFVDKGRFEALILGWNMAPDPDQFIIWHSSQTGPKQFNFVHFKNPEVDRLLEEGRSTFDREKRKAIYWRFQEVMAEEQPYVFLCVPEALFAIHKRFKGIVPAPSGVGYLSHLRWFVPPPYQKWTRTA